MAFLNAFFSAALDNNLVFAQLMGMLSVLLIAKRPQDAVRFGGLLALVALVAGLLGSGLYAGLLQPWGVAYLAPIAYVALDFAAALVVATIASRGASHDERAHALRFAGLLGVSSAVMGVSLASGAAVDAATATFESGLGTVAGSAFGVFLAVVLYAYVRDRIDDRLVPAAMRGLPIALVTASLMALAFTGVAGIASGMFA